MSRITPATASPGSEPPLTALREPDVSGLALWSALLIASSALIAFFATAPAHAWPNAVFAPRALPAIEPSTFIVAHPAGLALRAGHANHEHPAVTRKTLVPKLDISRHLVQPPATTRWSAASDAPAATLAQVPVIVR